MTSAPLPDLVALALSASCMQWCGRLLYAHSIALGRFLCMAPCRTSGHPFERLTFAGASVHAVPVFDPKVREDDEREGQPE
jgi:hypothetical protein